MNNQNPNRMRPRDIYIIPPAILLTLSVIFNSLILFGAAIGIAVGIPILYYYLTGGNIFIDE